jgi:hypothetical protein
MAITQYNRVIRKLVVGFGNLFNDITLVRYNPDLSEAERFKVPIAYASKEDYVMRLEGDYNLDKKIQITLPRLSFEMTGMTYDNTRKLNTNSRKFTQTTSGQTISQYNPVPYNFDFNLYMYIRNIEDGTQIIEHILPYFAPDYTIKLNLIPEMGIVKEIPIILNSTDMPVDNYGTRDRETRVLIWTLNFTVKGYVFGNVNDVSNSIIRHSITNIFNKINPDDTVLFTLDTASGIGTYQVGEIVYQGFSHGTAVASATVTLFENNVLHLTNIQGNFISNLPIQSTNSNTNYLFTDYRPIQKKLVEINVDVDPSNANVTDPWIATTTITETNT